ncbi:MAG: tyrosine-type recombinase/integrase [Methylococcales bacterium]
MVLNRDEVQAILSRLTGTYWVIASLLYGTGMRSLECLPLRVQDVDMKRKEILIGDGTGFKDRVTMLPVALITPLKERLVKVREPHQSHGYSVGHALPEWPVSAGPDFEAPAGRRGSRPRFLVFQVKIHNFHVKPITDLFAELATIRL